MLLKRSLFLALVFLASSAFHHAKADQVFLKSGETIECKVLRQDDSGVLIKYHLSRGIIDEKTIPAAEISKVLKTTPDQKAYGELKALFPTPDLMSVEEYNEMIEREFSHFLKNFPESDYRKEVKKLLAELQTERNFVAAGQRKIDSKWISPAEYKRKEYTIEARLAQKEIDLLIGKRAYRKALLKFQELEDSYEMSIAYPEAVVSALSALNSYEAEIDGHLSRHALIVKQREQGIKLVDFPRRAKIEQAIKDEIARYEATRKQETEEALKWMTIYPHDLKGLEDEKATIREERERLSNIDLKTLRATSVHIAKAFEHFADQEFFKATAAISKASAAGADDQLITKLKEKMGDIKAGAEDVMETGAAANAQAKAALDSVSGDEWGTGEGSGQPGLLMGSRVTIPTDPGGRSALQIKREENEKKKAEENEKKKAEQAAQVEAISQKTEEIATEAKAAAEAAVTGVTDILQEEVGGGGGLLSKLPFLLAPALIVLLVVAVNNKKKEKDGEKGKKGKKGKKQKEEKEEE